MSNNALEVQVTALVDSIEIGDLTTEDEYHIAGEYLRQIKTLHKRIVDHHKPIKDQIKLALDVTRQQEKGLLDPLERVRGRLENVRGEYRARVKAAQEEEQRRLQRILQDSATEQAGVRVAELVEKGDIEGAQVLVNRIEKGEVKPVSEVPLQLKPPKSEGVGTRTLKRVRLVDINKVKTEYLMLDKVKVNKVMRIHGAKVVEIVGVGGVEYYEEETEIVRGLD